MQLGSLLRSGRRRGPDINFGEIRFRTTMMTVAELVEHYRQRELMQVWAQAIMRYHIGPAGRKTELQKRVGWHTFRHTYSTLLKLVGADIKVMQELLRHSSVRCTLDTYTQAIMPAKRAAQAAVVSMILSERPSNANQSCTVLHP